MIATLALSVGAFVATNLDDIFLLAALFAAPQLRPRSVVLGQMLGIAALVAGCALCASIAVLVPPRAVALLGLLPLGIGAWQLVARWRGEADDEDFAADERRAQRRLHSQVLAVAAITLANGGDNVGVYIPLFAQDPPAIALHALVFLLLTLAWCGLGFALVNNRAVGAAVSRWGQALLPFVLIALGLYILLAPWW